MKACPGCGTECHDQAVECKKCLRPFAGYETVVTKPLSPFESEQRKDDKRRSARRIVWGVALAIIALASLDTWLTLQTAVDISAPQQAAGAAMGLFYSATPYMIARGIDAMLR